MFKPIYHFQFFTSSGLIQPALSHFGHLYLKSHIFCFPKTFLAKWILDIYKCPFSDFPKKSWQKKVKKWV